MARGATPCGAADTVSTALLRAFVASAVLAQSARAQSLAPTSHLNHSGGVYWDSHYRDGAAVATEISREVLRELSALAAWLASLLLEQPYQTCAACCAVFFVVATGPSLSDTAPAPPSASPLRRGHRARGGPFPSQQPVVRRGSVGGAGPRSRPPAAVDWRTSVGDADLAALRSTLGEGGGDAQRGAWEEVLSRSSPEGDLCYTAWCRPSPAGGGLREWKATTVYGAAQLQDVIAFQLDTQRRADWDSGVQTFSQLEVEHSSQPGPAAVLEHWRMRYPAPFAPRDYICARRVWLLPEGPDGQQCLYVVSKTPQGPLPRHLEEALPAGRAHRVETFCSGVRVRAVPTGVELSTVYHEDAGVKASLVDWTVRRSLWAFVEKQARGMEAHAGGARGGTADAQQAAVRRREGRLGVRKALGGAGGTLVTYVSAFGRGMAAAALAGASPEAKHARRAQRAAAQAQRRAQAQVGGFDPVAQILQPLRERLHVQESLHRRAQAAMQAGATHIAAERARRQARALAEGPRRADAREAGAAIRGKVLMVVAAIALRAVHKKEQREALR